MFNADRGTALILVVDDDWMNREVMEAHLLAAGYEVLLARSGEEALALSFERDPDLILLDVRMQGMTGYEVCAAMRAHERTQTTPIVMVTALDRDEEKQQALDAGADDFIIKPFTSLTMLARVKSLVRISRLQREVKALQDASACLIKTTDKPMPKKGTL